MPVEVKEALEDIREESMAKGMVKGVTIGKIKAIVELLKKGLISEEVALSALELSKEELNRKIKELKI